VFWWGFASLMLWFPIAITGIAGRTGLWSFRLCQAWVWIGNFIGGVRPEVVPNPKVDKNQSYVIVSNHQSFYDIPALMLKVGVPFRWVIKKEFRFVPLFGWALFFAGHIFIDRSQPKAAINSLNDAVKNLRPGVSVAVFAEGSRSCDGGLREFKSGAFIAALAAGLPILPITINGSCRIMPDKQSLNFYPGRIQVVIGDPIDTRAYSRANMGALIEVTRNAVAANLDPSFPLSSPVTSSKD
jgi:1-acyl-sn-glycerol-3-phosphate acyltransferase